MPVAALHFFFTTWTVNMHIPYIRSDKLEGYLVADLNMMSFNELPPSMLQAWQTLVNFENSLI